MGYRLLSWLLDLYFSYCWIYKPILVSKCSKNYKTLEDRATRDYHIAVTTSDEAFAWQVLTNYYKVWEEELKEATENARLEDGNRGNEKGKVGPKKGFKNTAGKTVDKYNDYVCRLGRSRKGLNARLWSITLKQAAQKEKMLLDKAKKEEEPDESAEDVSLEEVYLEQDFMEYTQIDLEEAMKSAEAL